MIDSPKEAQIEAQQEKGRDTTTPNPSKYQGKRKPTRY
jgi:hypothetical protein